MGVFDLLVGVFDLFRRRGTEPAGFGGLTRAGDALPGFAPALTSRSTMASGPAGWRSRERSGPPPSWCSYRPRVRSER